MTKKQLSRREALKVLGAAAAMASLPPTWKEPELIAGKLPAHAQTSETRRGFQNIPATIWNGYGDVSFSVYGSYVSPANSTVNYTITINGTGDIGGNKNFIGSFLTDSFGDGSTGSLGDPENFVPGDTITEYYSSGGWSYLKLNTIT